MEALTLALLFVISEFVVKSYIIGPNTKHDIAGSIQEHLVFVEFDISSEHHREKRSAVRTPGRQEGTSIDVIKGFEFHRRGRGGNAYSSNEDFENNERNQRRNITSENESQTRKGKRNKINSSDEFTDFEQDKGRVEAVFDDRRKQRDKFNSVRSRKGKKDEKRKGGRRKMGKFEAFELPEFTTVTIRGMGDPVTIDLKKKEMPMMSDESMIFQISRGGKMQKRRLKNALAKQVGYYTTMDDKQTFQLSCRKKRNATEPECRLRGGMKNQKQVFQFIETEAKHNNRVMKEKLKALKKEIGEEKTKKGVAHVVVIPDSFTEDLRGDTLFPGKDRSGRKLKNAPKLWDKKMSVKKKQRKERRKSRKRAKRAAFTYKDATYRLTSYGEHVLHRRMKRSANVVEEDEGLVEILTAVDQHYVNFWISLDAENYLSLMSTYLQYLVVDVDTRLFNMRRTDNRIKLRAIHAGIFVATEAEANWTSSDILYDIVKVADGSILTVLDMDESILRLASMKEYLIDLGMNFDHITAITRRNIGYKSCPEESMDNTTNCWTTGSTGYAYIGAMCKYPSYSVSLVEDPTRGLVSWTISHEIGHSLGAFHDSGDCQDYFLMNSMRSWVSNPDLSHKTSNYFHISPCSAVNIYDNIFTGLPDDKQCLWNDDLTETQFDTFFSLPRPGEVFDLNEQCQFVAGNASFNCPWKSERLCWQYAFCADTNGCKPMFVRDGTPCGTDMVCRDGACENYTDIFISTTTPIHVTTLEELLSTAMPTIPTGETTAPTEARTTEKITPTTPNGEMATEKLTSLTTGIKTSTLAMTTSTEEITTSYEERTTTSTERMTTSATEMTTPKEEKSTPTEAITISTEGMTTSVVEITTSKEEETTSTEAMTTSAEELTLSTDLVTTTTTTAPTTTSHEELSTTSEVTTSFTIKITKPTESTTPSESTTTPSESTTISSETMTIPSESTTIPSESTITLSESTTTHLGSTTTRPESTTTPLKSTTTHSLSMTTPSESTTTISESTTSSEFLTTSAEEMSASTASATSSTEEITVTGTMTTTVEAITLSTEGTTLSTEEPTSTVTTITPTEISTSNTESISSTTEEISSTTEAMTTSSESTTTSSEAMTTSPEEITAPTESMITTTEEITSTPYIETTSQEETTTYGKEITTTTAEHTTTPTTEITTSDNEVETTPALTRPVEVTTTVTGETTTSLEVLTTPKEDQGSGTGNRNWRWIFSNGKWKKLFLSSKEKLKEWMSQWGEWSMCSYSCEQSRTRRNGRQSESRTCSDGFCGNDRRREWGSWSVCGVSCKQYRMRRDGESQRQTCAGGLCKRYTNIRNEWSSWSLCSFGCVQHRSRGLGSSGRTETQICSGGLCWKRG